MKPETTVLSRLDGKVCLITLNRPQVRNAIDTATMRLLGEEVAAAQADPACRVLVITGAGDLAFSAGGDMHEMHRSPSIIDCDLDMHVWQDVLGRIEKSHKPVIAAIKGYAFGGGTELAMACHLRVCSPDAQFGQTEIRHDHLPGAGGTQRLPRLLPLAVAYEMLLTGDAIGAQDALRLGFVTHVWPIDELLPRTLALARRIAERAPAVVRYTMEAVQAGLNGSLDTGLRLERAMAALVMDTQPAQTGLKNFVEKVRA